MRLFSTLVFFLSTVALWGQHLPAKPATALNKVILYPDSSFFAHSNIFYEEGTLFEIVNETRFEYEDEAQNQKFKWYQVNTPDGQTGWIFGDGIAVLVPESEVPAPLRPFYLRTFNFSDDLEETTAWVASIEGKDNFYKEDILNPLYKEYYLVLTSQLGKSFHIQFASESAMGSSEIRQLLLKDITEDRIPEILLVKSNFDNGTAVEDRVLEIYSFQAGSVSKVFEERMSLSYAPKIPSPAQFKFVEVDAKTIRVAYVDYIDCKEYTLPYIPNQLDETHEKCMEYVTYSFVWEDGLQQYIPLYEKSRTYVAAELQTERGYLRTAPSYLSDIAEKLPVNAKLSVIQHFEKVITQRGKQKLVPYLYVQSEAGNYGYIHARDVSLKVGEHGPLLNQFYQAPPLNKTDWTPDTNFLTLRFPDSTLILTKKE
ncbi:MAG: SH3 domain-containing protein [Bacteroidota bacterium]